MDFRRRACCASAELIRLQASAGIVSCLCIFHLARRLWARVVHCNVLTLRWIRVMYLSVHSLTTAETPVHSIQRDGFETLIHEEYQGCAVIEA